MWREVLPQVLATLWAAIIPVGVSGFAEVISMPVEMPVRDPCAFVESTSISRK